MKVTKVGVGSGCFLLFLIAIFQPLSSYDLGYHLSTGRFILQNHIIPQKDPFSFTNPTGIWPLHQWLPATLYYGFYHVFGAGSLKVLKAILIVFSGGLIFLSAVRLKKERFLVFVLTVISLLFASHRMLLRPYLFSVIMYAFLYFHLTRIDLDGNQYQQTQKKINLGLLLCFFLWAHFHAGVVVGVLLVLLWAIGFFIDHGKVPVRSILSVALGLVLGFCSVGVYNPGGLHGLLVPFLFIKDTFYQKHIAEFGALSFFQNEAFYFLMILSISYGIYHFRKVSWSYFLPFIMFFMLATQTNRLLIYASMSLPIYIVSLVRCGALKINKKPFANYFYFVIILILMIEGFSWAYNKNSLAQTFNSQVLPIDALKYAKRLNIKGNVFNEDAWGGWVSFYLFPQTLTYVDNRLPVYGTSFYQDRYLPIIRGEKVFEEEFQRYNVHWVILKNELKNPLQKQLLSSPNWKMAYIDDLAVIWVRGDMAVPSISMRPSFFKPDYLMSDADIERYRLLPSAERSAWVHNFIGVQFAKNGKISFAKNHFRLAQEIKPCHMDASVNLLKIENLEGDTKAGLGHLETFIRNCQIWGEDLLYGYQELLIRGGMHWRARKVGRWISSHE